MSKSFKRKILFTLIGAAPGLFFIFCIFIALNLPLMVVAGKDSVSGKAMFDGRAPLTDISQITLTAQTFKSGEPDEWLTGDVDINPVFAGRIAALAEKFGKIINISSGYRSIEEQWVIWNDRIVRYPNETEAERRRWVAYPGTSRHQFGLAADVDGYAKYLSNDELAPFGLYKPLPHENWHIEPVETRGNGIYDVPNLLPDDLKFVEVNRDTLRAWLRNRNSLLAEEPYFEVIIDTAAKFNLNPLLLFAITGQEQSFVPKSDVYAKKIANNPFNIYHSWQEHNINIQESAEVASRTIINLSKNRPASEHPIKWINTRGGNGGYAEDETWYVGVTRLLTQMRREIM